MHFIRLVALAILTGLLTSCAKAKLHHQESFVFGTRVEVLIAGLEEPPAGRAAAMVLREFDRLHRTYHAWQPSELSTLNDAIANGRTLDVTPEMAGLLIDAQRLAKASDRLFDPGIGGLVRLWGFHSDEFRSALPDPVGLAAWRAAHPGIADLQIEGTRVSSRNRAVAIDFGGYLKGVALDRAAAILHGQGVNNALINIGGNVMALGTRNGERWRVGIQHPRQPGPMATVELNDGEAIGTSGDYQRYFEVNGQRYSHLLDPRSGAPATQTRSLTVIISPQPAAGALSDAASKPLFILGPAWPEMAERLLIDQILRVDADGRIQASTALRRRLEFVGIDAKAVKVLRLDTSRAHETRGIP